jgi:hypothetical protein
MEYVVKIPIERFLCASALENVEHLVTVVHKKAARFQGAQPVPPTRRGEGARPQGHRRL